MEVSIAINVECSKYSWRGVRHHGEVHRGEVCVKIGCFGEKRDSFETSLTKIVTWNI